MIDYESYRKIFKEHVATLTECGNIKVLTFKKPDSIVNSIRFVFDEDVYRLYISGDLGSLIASNYNNMTYESFDDFVRSPEYFRRKIVCHDRPFEEYSLFELEDDLREILKADGAEEKILNDYESIYDFISEAQMCLGDNGLNDVGVKICSKYISDFWECARSVGRVSSKIIETYLAAFKFAKEQITVGLSLKKKIEGE